MKLIDFLNTDKDLPIDGVTSDSRQVKDNYLFAALQGSKANGAAYIEDAIHHGARIILASEGVNLPKDAEDVVIINDNNPRQAFAKIAAKFYKLQPKHIVA
ncbi:MAG TPA: Mur ligase domain-containing protein, partial [Alphaproteobacteria bacterium]|nr:Mur ligase domain-containing protein [Alphaproteobacteria bacterium]